MSQKTITITGSNGQWKCEFQDTLTEPITFPEIQRILRSLKTQYRMRNRDRRLTARQQKVSKLVAAAEAKAITK